MVVLAIVSSYDFGNYSVFKNCVNNFIASNNIVVDYIVGMDVALAERYASEYKFDIITHKYISEYRKMEEPVIGGKVIKDATHMIAFVSSHSYEILNTIKRFEEKCGSDKLEVVYV